MPAQTVELEITFRKKRGGKKEGKGIFSKYFPIIQIMDSQDSVNHGTQAILNCLYEPLSRE